MKRTTPPPRKNVLDVLPELIAQTVITVRLHPRRGSTALADSKLEGLFLWPKDESWPTCAVGHPDWLKNTWAVEPGVGVTLVPVLQLRADEFPEIEFYPGMDLLQVLWCPQDHHDVSVAKPFIFWRNTAHINETLESIPTFVNADERYIPQECYLLPERVQEFPQYYRLTEDQQSRLDTWDISDSIDDTIDVPSTLYEWELSVCPSTKIGGDVYWVQYPQWPTCQCGQTMQHLLTINDSEFDGGTYQRWLPVEDQFVWEGDYQARWVVQNAADIRLGGLLYIFICRMCENWPIRAVYQR